MKKFLSIILCMVLVVSVMQIPAYAKKTQKNNKTKTEKIQKKKIVIKSEKLSDGVYVTYKNNNKSAVCVTISITYKDGIGTVLRSDEYENQVLAKGKTAAKLFQAPMDGNENYLDYSSYECTVTKISKAKVTDLSKKIVIMQDIGESNVTIKCANTALKTVGVLSLSIILYDNNGNNLKIVDQALSNIESSEIRELTIDYNGMQKPAKIKIYKNFAV